jgi:hypothetical protein
MGHEMYALGPSAPTLGVNTMELYTRMISLGVHLGLHAA